MRLYIATGESVARVDDGNVTLALPGSAAQCVAADGDRVFVGTFDHGIHRSLDGGSTWTDVSAGIPHPRVLSVTISPHGEVYAGTEPSSLYRSTDDGATWEDLSALREVPSYDTWFFPPRPETHHVRWIAPHATNRDTIVVGIELGGVLRTRDGGKTFEDRHPDAVIDPHVVHAHPRAIDRVYAIGGDGVSYSLDTGDTWSRDTEGMDRFYTWGLAVDPVDADLWYVSAAPGPDRAHGGGDSQGRLYRRRNGTHWEPILSADPIADMPYALAAPAPDTLVAGMRSGEIRVSTDAGDTWRTLDANVPGILALAAA
jgi:photosystem II stability/assembly factor-like uncharacterized protein